MTTLQYPSSDFDTALEPNVVKCVQSLGGIDFTCKLVAFLFFVILLITEVQFFRHSEKKFLCACHCLANSGIDSKLKSLTSFHDILKDFVQKLFTFEVCLFFLFLIVNYLMLLLNLMCLCACINFRLVKQLIRNLV